MTPQRGTYTYGHPVSAVFNSGRSERRAFAGLLLPHEILQELMSKGLVRYPRADLSGLFTVACRDGEHFPVNRKGAGIGSPVDFDVDRVACHRKAFLATRCWVAVGVAQQPTRS